MSEHAIGTTLPPDVGAWDQVTRGFWTGGRYVRAGELAPGDVFREGCLSGWVVREVRPAPGSWADPAPCVHVVTSTGAVRIHAAAGVLELMSSGAR